MAQLDSPVEESVRMVLSGECEVVSFFTLGGDTLSCLVVGANVCANSVSNFGKCNDGGLARIRWHCDFDFLQNLKSLDGEHRYLG